MCVDGAAFSREVRLDVLRGFRVSCILYVSGTASESKLCFCRAFAEPNCNLARHSRNTTSELGLSDCRMSGRGGFTPALIYIKL